MRKHQAELSAGSHDLSADQAVTQPRRVPHHAAGPGPGQNGQTSAPLGTRDTHPAVRLQGSPLQSSLHRNCSFPLSGRPPASTPPTGSCRRTRPCHSPATWPDASWLAACQTNTRPELWQAANHVRVHTHTHTRTQARTPHTYPRHTHPLTLLHDNTRAHKSPSSEAAGAERATGRSWKGSHARLRVPGDKQDQGTAEVRELKNDTRVRGERTLKSPARY